jgi:hypothetical protein
MKRLFPDSENKNHESHEKKAHSNDKKVQWKHPSLEKYIETNRYSECGLDQFHIVGKKFKICHLNPLFVKNL